jgi:hypothetical protein
MKMLLRRVEFSMHRRFGGDNETAHVSLLDRSTDSRRHTYWVLTNKHLVYHPKENNDGSFVCFTVYALLIMLNPLLRASLIHGIGKP